MGVVNTGGCGLFGRTGSNLLPTALYHDVILIIQAMVLIISKRFHISVETAREIYNNEATKTLIELFTTNS